MNVRPATREDFPAIADLFRTADEAATGRTSSLDVESVDGWFQTISLETNTWLLQESDSLVGAAFAQLHGTRGNAAGAVHPTARGRGHGTRLAELVEGRLAEEGAARIHSWYGPIVARTALSLSEYSFAVSRTASQTSS